MEKWCPIWNARLFPYHEGSLWARRPEYEIPRIIELQAKIERERARVDKKTKQLELQIADIRESEKDWYTLLTGTGDELVQAVIRLLKSFGFKKVVDVDEESKSSGQGESLREDVRIEDQQPIIVVDIKGVSGGIEDADAMQSQKHALMRVREIRDYAKPLTIINHQRNLPPKDRNPNAYRQEIIKNAEELDVGLLTTWDLFCIMRNQQKLNWPNEQIRPIFYRTGRIEPIPEHYQFIDSIIHVWEHSFGIIPNTDIPIGSRISIEIDESFLEVEVVSLNVDGVAVQIAPAYSNCGVGFKNKIVRLKEGLRVFLLD